MANLCCEEYSRYNSWLFKAKPAEVPMTTLAYQPGLKQTGLLLFFEVGSAPSISLVPFEGWQDSLSKHKHMPVCLRLPADDFIRYTEETLCKQQDVWNSVEHVTHFKSAHSARSLSPNTGEKRMEVLEGTALLHKQPQFSFESMFDVEPSVTRNLVAYGKSVHKHVIETFTRKNEEEACIFSNLTSLTMSKRTSHLDMAETTSGCLYGDYSQDQAPSSTGTVEWTMRRPNYPAHASYSELV